MFRIKICGVRFKSDIDAVRSAGADAVGLNFFPPSVRYLDPAADATAELSAFAHAGGLYRVGVFVNESAGRIGDVVAKVGLDAIQLHGDERVSDLADYQNLGLPLIHAVKLPAGTLAPEEIERLARPWIDRDCQILLDVDAGPQHGGSGQSLDWDSLERWSAQHANVRWALAGGLHSQNVAAAIQASGAKSVDVASGVEAPRGQKSSDLIHQFCVQTRSAWG
ncbi:N-(5'-phosphoribosyl)anthranilate isomerase [Novipirellula galeiformis]|uniref:N-(5'-phosphoribosyl)anthranilate isomerase n=1 Tax=Novipirellula galeiformis TaxID=2528004 RepID=A0A5C6CD60_9BACT|nr:phosphoribosylanthranilate isomerase [Novipirellula galeiformis]TWU21995.1 N-(5'-phosphoribosyl)anthranilate isomerase [Novipirellula galeiformis]